MDFKKVNGYLTVEASFIMPMVLFLYLAVLTAALFLYGRCTVSQDCFLLSMRGACFTWAAEDYGEVIYGNEKFSNLQKETYMLDRWKKRGRHYFGGRGQEILCIVDYDCVYVKVCGKNTMQNIEKQVDILNPVEQIRERRKRRNA